MWAEARWPARWCRGWCRRWWRARSSTARCPPVRTSSPPSADCLSSLAPHMPHLHLRPARTRLQGRLSHRRRVPWSTSCSCCTLHSWLPTGDHLSSSISIPLLCFQWFSDSLIRCRTPPSDQFCRKRYSFIIIFLFLIGSSTWQFVSLILLSVQNAYIQKFCEKPTLDFIKRP